MLAVARPGFVIGRGMIGYRGCVGDRSAVELEQRCTTIRRDHSCRIATWFVAAKTFKGVDYPDSPPRDSDLAQFGLTGVVQLMEALRASGAAGRPANPESWSTRLARTCSGSGRASLTQGAANLSTATSRVGMSAGPDGAWVAARQPEKVRTAREAFSDPAGTRAAMGSRKSARRSFLSRRPTKRAELPTASGPNPKGQTPLFVFCQLPARSET